MYFQGFYLHIFPIWVNCLFVSKVGKNRKEKMNWAWILTALLFILYDSMLGILSIAIKDLYLLTQILLILISFKVILSLWQRRVFFIVIMEKDYDNEKL